MTIATPMARSEFCAFMAAPAMGTSLDPGWGAVGTGGRPVAVALPEGIGAPDGLVGRGGGARVIVVFAEGSVTRMRAWVAVEAAKMAERIAVLRMLLVVENLRDVFGVISSGVISGVLYVALFIGGRQTKE